MRQPKAIFAPFERQLAKVRDFAVQLRRTCSQRPDSSAIGVRKRKAERDKGHGVGMEEWRYEHFR